MLAMQSQPLVDESPQHHHHHHHRKIPHHHSGLPSLNRFRLAVRNVAHSLHLNHHHHHQRAGAGSPDPSVAPHPTRHKFHGASSLLGRFRSAKLNMSDDSDQATPLTTTKPLAAEAAKTDQKEDLGDPCRQDTWTPPEVDNPPPSDAPGNDATTSDQSRPPEGEHPDPLANGGDPSGSAQPADGAGETSGDLGVEGAAGPPDSHQPHQGHTDMETEGVRVYKKVSTNGKLVLYLINRDLVISKDSVSPLHAVVTVEPDEIRNRKIFAQILLTFRYGRDDEEVMGLKLSNESVLCVEQVYPLLPNSPPPQPLTKCQEVLMKRLGPQAHLVNMRLNHAVPPSVRLLPAKEYRGAAIGINYDLRVYTAESIEEKPQRRSQVRMAIRVVQYAPMDIQQTEAPQLRLEKHFLLREGTILIEAGLDRQWYTQGSPIVVCIRINNRSSRIVKKIQIRAIQHVDVTMFSNGKFKNTIAASEECDGLPVAAGQALEHRFPLSLMENGGGRHWVALEDRYGKLTATLASTTLKSAPNERHFFAIYISYYVKVRLVVSGVGGDVSIKIPFILMRDGPDLSGGDTEDGAAMPSHCSRTLPDRPASADTPPVPEASRSSPVPVEGAACVEEVRAELHPEPANPPEEEECKNGPEELEAAHSSSPADGTEPTVSLSGLSTTI